MKKAIKGSVVLFSVAIIVLLTSNITLAATPQVTAGDHHTLAIKSDGALWAWGWNEDGELGDGTMVGRHSPVRIGSDCSWEHVAAGTFHTVATKSNGTLWVWGNNDYYKLGLGYGQGNEEYSPVQVGTDSNWEQVAAATFHTVATKSNGTLWAWGWNEDGQLGDGTWIDRDSPVQIGSASNWEQVAAGQAHTVAIKSDGTLWAWGENGYGQLGVVGTTDRPFPVQVGTDSNWEQLAAGAFHTVATKSNGTLWAWGRNDLGQLGDGTTTERHSPVQIGSASNWEQVAAGQAHTVAIKSDGTLWAWGWNMCGELGDGTTVRRHSPVRIGSDCNWEQVAAGALHTVATKSNGTLWAWGENGYGQLGDGTTTERHSPVLISDLLTSPTIPIPTNCQSFTYSSATSPVLSGDPSQAKTMGVGPVAEGGGILSITIQTFQFLDPVDIYFGLYSPDIDPDNIYLLTSSGAFQNLSEGLAPWKANITGPIDESLFGDIQTSSLPKGTYYLCLLVTPTGNLTSYYLWITSFGS